MNAGVGIELFAQAGFRDEGEVLRYGVPQTNRRDLATRALGPICQSIPRLFR